MALVFRNGRPYLYRSVRRGGRVTSEYLGRGIDAQLIAALEADERDWKRFDREQVLSERKQVDDLERSLDELVERARDHARDALTAAGYHQHKRGEWRSAVSDDIVKWNIGERVMDNWAVARLIDWAGGKDGNKQTKAALREELCDVADKLAGPNPSSAETVLAQTAATCWFAFRLHEAQYAASVKSEDGMTLAQSEHAQRRIDRAHRRFLSTVKTLAAVRRLALPALQINVARQQVNQLNAGGSL